MQLNELTSELENKKKVQELEMGTETIPKEVVAMQASVMQAPVAGLPHQPNPPVQLNPQDLPYAQTGEAAYHRSQLP